MFNSSYFIAPYVFALLGILFSLGITEKIPQQLNYNLGKLNVDDIRAMGDAKRSYLQKQVILYFALAAILTFLISLAFVLMGFFNNGLMICLVPYLLEILIGFGAISILIKKANTIKLELSSK